MSRLLRFLGTELRVLERCPHSGHVVGIEIISTFWESRDDGTEGEICCCQPYWLPAGTYIDPPLGRTGGDPQRLN